MNGLSVEVLLALFPGPDTALDYEVVPGEAVPQPYHGLLVHEHHMTVTVEAFHGDAVNVWVLERNFDAPHYARKILLALRSTDRVVQFGIARINLEMTSPEVREAILAARTPLGRVLIEHDVLRRIEPLAFLKVRPKPEQLAWFGEGVTADVLYGRLAIIRLDGKPAIEVLEIVAP